MFDDLYDFRFKSSNSEKKKRVSRINGGGLRQFSVIGQQFKSKWFSFCYLYKEKFSAFIFIFIFFFWYWNLI